MRLCCSGYRTISAAKNNDGLLHSWNNFDVARVVYFGEEFADKSTPLTTDEVMSLRYVSCGIPEVFRRIFTNDRTYEDPLKVLARTIRERPKRALRRCSYYRFQKPPYQSVNLFNCLNILWVVTVRKFIRSKTRYIYMPVSAVLGRLKMFYLTTRKQFS